MCFWSPPYDETLPPPPLNLSDFASVGLLKARYYDRFDLTTTTTTQPPPMTTEQTTTSMSTSAPNPSGPLISVTLSIGLK